VNAPQEQSITRPVPELFGRNPGYGFAGFGVSTAIESGATRSEDPADVVARIYADFQNTDPRGRIRLNTVGSQLDLEGEQAELADGLELVVYSEDLEAHGVVRVLDEGGWGVEINWSEVTDLP
jgi:hypothetical protein